MGTSMMNDKDHVAQNEATETTPMQANSIVITQLVPKNGIEAAADDNRENWGQKMDFLLSVIGFAVDLANVWRFPYLCFKNGGGAFLIPYFSMLLVGGIPLFYMELALGQFYRTGAITCWARVCPIAKGIGWAVVLIAFYTDFFYNVVIAWSLHFFFASFTSELPWTTCKNYWNTKHCFDIFGPGDTSDNASDFADNSTFYNVTSAERYLVGSVTNLAGNVTNLVGKLAVNGTNSTSAADISKRTLPAAEYFDRKMLELHKSDGIFGVGEIKWQMVLCLLGVYIICYFSLWKGIKMSGKVVWFTALFPYVVLTVLMIRGATLPGAADGVRYYLTPVFSRLGNSEVWVDAATQVFFSLGPGFGVLLAFASYNPIHNNVYKDALITSAVNCGTSFMSGFVIFMILGYMSEKAKVPIQEVATEGPGLVFIVYPAAIATLPGATFWAIIFFLMLLTLGLDSSFGGSEAIITAMSDEFPVIRRHREIFVALLFSLYFVVGLAFCTQGGAYVVRLMDAYAAGYSILFAVFCETVTISWVYGVERFSSDIHMMLGFKPGIYWRVCWKFIAPVFILFIMIFGLVLYHPLDYDDYKYPLSANLIGWTIACSSILCIPLFAVVQIYRAEGTLLERIRYLLKPARDTRVNEVTVTCNDVRLAGEHPNADHV